MTMIYSTRPCLLPAWVLAELIDGPPELPPVAEAAPIAPQAFREEPFALGATEVPESVASVEDSAEPEAEEGALWDLVPAGETVELPRVPVPPPFRHPRGVAPPQEIATADAIALEAPSIALEPSLTRALPTPPAAESSDGVTIILRVPSRGIVQEVAPAEPALSLEAVAVSPSLVAQEEPSVILEAVPVQALESSATPRKKPGRAA
jgi:hypothetical protein